MAFALAGPPSWRSMTFRRLAHQLAQLEAMCASLPSGDDVRTARSRGPLHPRFAHGEYAAPWELSSRSPCSSRSRMWPMLASTAFIRGPESLPDRLSPWPATRRSEAAPDHSRSCCSGGTVVCVLPVPSAGGVFLRASIPHRRLPRKTPAASLVHPSLSRGVPGAHAHQATPVLTYYRQANGTTADRHSAECREGLAPGSGTLNVLRNLLLDQCRDGVAARPEAHDAPALHATARRSGRAVSATGRSPVLPRRPRRCLTGRSAFRAHPPDLPYLCRSGVQPQPSPVSSSSQPRLRAPLQDRAEQLLCRLGCPVGQERVPGEPRANRPSEAGCSICLVHSSQRTARLDPFGVS